MTLFQETNYNISSLWGHVPIPLLVLPFLKVAHLLCDRSHIPFGGIRKYYICLYYINEKHNKKRKKSKEKY